MNITESALESLASLCGMSTNSATYVAVRAVYVDGLSKGEAAKVAGIARSGAIKGCQRIEDVKDKALAVAQTVKGDKAIKVVVPAPAEKVKPNKVKWSFVQMIGHTMLSSRCVCLYSGDDGSFLLRAETDRGRRARYSVVTQDKYGKPLATSHTYSDMIVNKQELDAFIEEVHDGIEFDRDARIVAAALELMKSH